MARRNKISTPAGTHDASKRDFVKKAVYVAPAILSMQAYSALAKAGSNKDPSGSETSCKAKKPSKC